MIYVLIIGSMVFGFVLGRYAYPKSPKRKTMSDRFHAERRFAESLIAGGGWEQIAIRPVMDGDVWIMEDYYGAGIQRGPDPIPGAIRRIVRSQRLPK